jgi:CBS domain containing-hemolysin-like protein
MCMTALLLGALFAGITLLAIGLQRTYYHYPLKELKRRARKGDPLANLLYKPVSYGVSLQVLLWAVVIMSAASSFVLLSNAFEMWFAVILVSLLLWLGFLWLPSSQLTGVSMTIAKTLTPVVNVVLYRLHPLLQRIGQLVQRFRHIVVRTGLYEKEDLSELLEKQRELPDNRILESDIDLLQHALWFGDKLVGDAYVPLRAVQTVAESEAIGPKLMDDLYKSGHSRFPVYKDDQSNIVGTLYLRDLVQKQVKGHVRDVMKPDVFYVHEDFTLPQVLQAFLKTKHHLFIVVNSFEEFVGVITIEDILEQVIGKPIVDEFDKYEDMRAVAAAAAKEDHQARDQAEQYPAKDTDTTETNPKVLE